MSARLSREQVLFQQRLFACAGFYTAKIDGIWGPRTDKAAAQWDQAYQEIRDGIASFDARSEAGIRTLLPGMQKLARMLLSLQQRSGLDARVVSATRTYEEQNALYRQGRWGNPGDQVTRARGGQSWHNFGCAIDLGIFESGKYLDGDNQRERAIYTRAGERSSAIQGLEWGGLWRNPDLPHYQAATGLSKVELRKRFELGTRILSDPDV